MKTKKITLLKTVFNRFLITILFVISFSICFSQENIDTLKRIFSSKAFTLEEEYIGDWGGYLHSFTFSADNNNLRIKWENPELLKNPRELNVILPLVKLKNLEKIFTDGSSKINTSQKGSTEHIIYKFKNKEITYIIDDKFSMVFNDDFKAWKEMLLLEQKKQEKN